MTRLEEMTQAIIPLLLNAARTQGTVKFSALYGAARVSGNEERSECHRALEDAANLIRDWRIANYTSLMAKKDSGLPGDGFFDMFHSHRREEYVSLVGDVWITDLTQEQREKLTYAERIRVYSDAKTV